MQPDPHEWINPESFSSLNDSGLVARLKDEYMPLTFAELSTRFADIASNSGGSTDYQNRRLSDLETKAVRLVWDYQQRGIPAFAGLVSSGVRVSAGRLPEPIPVKLNENTWKTVRSAMAAITSARHAEICNALTGESLAVEIPDELRDRMPDDISLVGGCVLERFEQYDTGVSFGIIGYDARNWRDRALDDAEACTVLSMMAGESQAMPSGQPKAPHKPKKKRGRKPSRNKDELNELLDEIIRAMPNDDRPNWKRIAADFRPRLRGLMKANENSLRIAIARRRSDLSARTK